MSARIIASYAELVAIVADNLVVDAGEVEADTTFEELDLDSLVTIELAVVLENRHSIRLDDEQLREVGSFGAIAAPGERHAGRAGLVSVLIACS